MSRFSKLSHSIWHCQYHIVWTPKYRFRILKEDVKKEVVESIKVFSEQGKGKIVELNVQEDHVHLLVMIPPKISISVFVGIVKGKTAIRIFRRFPDLKIRPYWGNHFWAKGYCVDTVGLDSDKIRKYVKYQEGQEKQFGQ